MQFKIQYALQFWTQHTQSDPHWRHVGHITHGDFREQNPKQFLVTSDVTSDIWSRAPSSQSTRVNLLGPKLNDQVLEPTPLWLSSKTLLWFPIQSTGWMKICLITLQINKFCVFFIYFTYIADLNFYKEFNELNSFEYQSGSQMFLRIIESRRTFQIVPQEHGRSIRV